MNFEKTSRCFMSGNHCKKLINYYSPSFSPTRTQVFVIMPFKQPYFDYYNFAIKDVYSSSNGFECKYGAESIFMTGEYIICKICEEIVKADLVIADISEGNPNVYYELGLSHALGKKTITIINRNKDKLCGGFKEFLQSNTELREYSKIDGLKTTLAALTNKKIASFPFNPSENRRIIDKQKKDYSVICLIPDDNNENNVKTVFSEVFEFGIKKSIEKLEFPGDDLIKLNKKDVYNIISEAQKSQRSNITNLINYIENARYCIIDMKEGHPEVFYWLGFIHGLGLNPYIDIREDLSYLYITQEALENLPFDIKAARVIRYNCLEGISYSISDEIEKLEIAILNDMNKGKYEFWKKFNFKNTKFLIGAADVCHPGEHRTIRNRISIQDFRTFNRITYLMLFLGIRKPFQYNMQVIELRDFLHHRVHKKDLCNEEMFNNPKEVSIVIESDDIKTKLGFDHSGDENKNYIIIGSSCVNAASELIMNSLYCNNNENYGYKFKTIRSDKARSSFWDPVEDTNNKGIYVLKDENDETKLVGIPKYKGDNIINDTGLLIITKDLELSEQVRVNGDIIILCGFSKYGTFELGRMISNYTNISGSLDEKIIITENNKKVIKYVNDFFHVINKIRKEKVDQSYCIEAVFEFEHVNKEKPEEIKRRLKSFYYFDRNLHKRKDLTKLF